MDSMLWAHGPCASCGWSRLPETAANRRLLCWALQPCRRQRRARMKLMVGKAMSFWLEEKNRLQHNISEASLEVCRVSAYTAVFHSVIGSMEVKERKRFGNEWFQHIGDRYSSINSLVKPEQHVRLWKLWNCTRFDLFKEAGIKRRHNTTRARDVGRPNAEESPTSVLSMGIDSV
jgi:hypothetical protein